MREAETSDARVDNPFERDVAWSTGKRSSSADGTPNNFRYPAFS